MATALLNIRRRFGVAAWVPVANNAVCIAVLIWFHFVDPSPVLGGTEPGRSTCSGFRLGTTAGVAIQFLCLVPSLVRSDLWRLLFSTCDDKKIRRFRSRLVDWAVGRSWSW